MPIPVPPRIQNNHLIVPQYVEINNEQELGLQERNRIIEKYF